MMTDAPDPGLTDLIAAHREGDYGRFGRQTCECGWTGDSHPAHLALVVEQHTNGRTAELAANIQHLSNNLDVARMGRATAEATIARVGKVLEAAEKSVPDDWGVTYIYTSRLRAALEGEQQ